MRHPLLSVGGNSITDRWQPQRTSEHEEVGPRLMGHEGLQIRRRFTLTATPHALG